MATKLAALKRRAKRAGIPSLCQTTIWHAGNPTFQKLLRHCLDEDVRGKPLATLLQPDVEDYLC